MSVSRRRRPAVLAATAATTVAVAAAVVGVAGPASAATSPPKVPGSQPCCGAAFLRPGQAIWRPSAAHPVGASLVSLGLASSPPPVATTQLGAYLVLQGDGNVVEYATDTHQVLFTTRTTTGAELVFQSDRNVVLYDDGGHALWSTHTAGSDAQYFSPYGNGELVAQRADGTVVARVGTPMTPAPGVVVEDAASPDGRWSFVVQGDGNLVEYRVDRDGSRRAVWASHTAGAGAVRLAAQSDGNLVLYALRTGRAVWASHTVGTGSAYYQLDAQDDGNVVLYRTDGVHRVQAVWSTGVHS